VAGRAVCSSRIPGEDPGSNGPGVLLMSSFRVEILRPRHRPRLGRTSPKVQLTPRVLLLPSIVKIRACRIGLSCSVCMFSAAAEAQTYHRRVVKLRFFSSCFEYLDLFAAYAHSYSSIGFCHRRSREGSKNRFGRRLEKSFRQRSFRA
jgi:hypothetical protein